MVSLLSLIVTICVFVEGDALKCYQCFAEGDESCDSEIVECPTTLPGYCGNLVGTYDGKRYFHQGCLRVNDCEAAAEDFRKYLRLLATDLFVVDCSSCSTDYCNSTGNISKFSFICPIFHILILYFRIV